MVAEADRIIPVRLTNRDTGNTHKKEIHNPGVDDFLDYIAELVTKMGGEVMVFPVEWMPTQTGLAAIYRY